jgi:hypothetical protein
MKKQSLKQIAANHRKMNERYDRLAERAYNLFCQIQKFEEMMNLIECNETQCRVAIIIEGTVFTSDTKKKSLEMLNMAINALIQQLEPMMKQLNDWWPALEPDLDPSMN